MCRLIFLLGILFCSYLHLYSQSYRIYRPISSEIAEEQPIPARIVRWEVGVGGVDSLGIIKDSAEDKLSSQLTGWRVNIGYAFGKRFWVIADWEQLEAADQTTHFLSKIKRNQFTCGIKWVLTPDVTSKVYMLAGIGKSFYQTKPVARKNNLNEQSMVYVLGVGGEFNLYKGLYLAGEYRFTYDAVIWENFVLKANRVRQEIALGFNYKF